MKATLSSIFAVFGLGIVYFLAAIPTGVALKLPPALAAAAAWAGYTAIAAAMLLLGTPAREWLQRKFKISLEPNPQKVFWRIWGRFGMQGLGLLAPVTTGPYIAALIALALGTPPRKVILWIALEPSRGALFLRSSARRESNFSPSPSNPGGGSPGAGEEIRPGWKKGFVSPGRPT